MRSVSTIALGVTLALGSVATTFTAMPLFAQQQAPQLSRYERAAFLELRTALETKNYPAATAALATAQSRARSSYARYLASALQLRLGIETGNIGLQTTAIDSMIGSGAAPASELPQLYRNQAALLQRAGKYERAEASLSRYLELAPNDADALLALSQIKDLRKKPREAVALIERAVDMRQAAGQPVPQGWLKRGISLAMANNLQPQAMKFSRGLVAAYPTPENWRDAAFIYRSLAPADSAAVLDSWRLQRAAKALAGERDYLQFAQALTAAGLAAESKAVLDEGVARKMVSPSEATFKELIVSSGKGASTEKSGLKARRTAAAAAATGADSLSVGDTLFGQGDYAGAATMYQAALQKGGVDPNLVNTRLGIALAMAGRRAEADAAFRAVAGPRADLATLWLGWLSRTA